MKKGLFILVGTILLGFLQSCTSASPEALGEKIARMYNDSYSKLSENINNIHTTYVKSFDGSQFTTRIEARDKFNSAIDQAILEYESACIKAETAYREAELKFTENYNKLLLFQQAFNLHIKANDVKELKKTAYTNALVDKLIATIIPSDPVDEKIKQDLVGRSIREPQNGYNEGKTTWNIEEGEVKFMEVIEKTKEDNNIIYKLRLVLKANGGAVDVRCTARYGLSDYDDDWTITMLTTETFDVVKTGKYDDCIEVQKDMFGYRFFNKSDSALTVGGVCYSWRWHKFQKTIAGNESGYIYCSDCKIHFIEIPY